MDFPVGWLRIIVSCRNIHRVCRSPSILEQAPTAPLAWTPARLKACSQSPDQSHPLDARTILPSAWSKGILW